MSLSLPDFSTGRVLVVGDVMLDRYWSGSTTRISPEAPVPVVRVEHDEYRPGGAGNVAMNVASLGAAAQLVGLVGRDEDAQRLRRQLQSGGVVCNLHEVASHPTITKLRILSRHQQLIRLDFERAFTAQESAAIPALFEAALTSSAAVVCSDYGKGSLSDVADLIAAARARGAWVVVDPKGADFSRYRGASVITPNQGEFEAVVGVCADEATLLARGEALRAQLELEALLITRSERGMTLLARAAEPLTLPTRARDVFDVTGAGDTVVAVLAAALASGMALPGATALANLAAGLVVAKLGTATVSADELRLACVAAPSSFPSTGASSS